MKKRKLKKQVITLILLLLTLSSLAVIGYVKYFHKNTTKIKEQIKEKLEPEEEKIKTYNLSLAATGDALLHMAVIRDGKKDDGTYDFSHQLTHIKEVLKDYDLAYYNQETPFGGDDKGYKGYPMFNSPSSYGDAMMEAGFNMVSLATNHTLDQGSNGVINFYNYWKDKDVMYHGIADSEETRNQYIIKEKNNITYSMLSYTTSTNGIPVPSGKEYLVNVYSEEQVKKDIEYLRDKVDVLIVAMHWGVEYTHTPTNEELEIAQFLADMDVDIVLGAHPHCIQPIDIIDDTIVYYSLGNFISNQGDIADKYGMKVIIGMLGTLNITKTVDGDNTSVEISNVGADLLYTYDRNNKNYQVIPFSMMHDNTYLNNYESVYEEFKGISTKLNENIIIAPLGSN